MFDSWLDRLIAKYASSGILVDSNLLLVFCVGNLDPNLVGIAKGTREYNLHDHQLLSAFIERFDHIQTTPNVLTEVSNLAGRLRDDIRSQFRVRLRNDTLRVLHEEYVATKEATAHSIYLQLGVTDAAIAMLGQKGVPVLTNDLNLSLMLESQNVECVHYDRVLRPQAFGN